jgi:excisionase family DNA binding protein
MSTEAIDDMIGHANKMLAHLHSLRATVDDGKPPSLLTFEQTAEALGVGRTTVQELVDKGELPVVSVTGRAVRVDVRDVEAFIKRKRERR